MSLVNEKVWERMKACYFSLCCLRMIVRVNVVQTPVVLKMDSTIHRINHYPVGEYEENQLRYPVDRDLSDG